MKSHKCDLKQHIAIVCKGRFSQSRDGNLDAQSKKGTVFRPQSQDHAQDFHRTTDYKPALIMLHKYSKIMMNFLKTKQPVCIGKKKKEKKDNSQKCLICLQHLHSATHANQRGSFTNNGKVYSAMMSFRCYHRG